MSTTIEQEVNYTLPRLYNELESPGFYRGGKFVDVFSTQDYDFLQPEGFSLQDIETFYSFALLNNCSSAILQKRTLDRT